MPKRPALLVAAAVMLALAGDRIPWPSPFGAAWLLALAPMLTIPWWAIVVSSLISTALGAALGQDLFWLLPIHYGAWALASNTKRPSRNLFLLIGIAPILSQAIHGQTQLVPYLLAGTGTLAQISLWVILRHGHSYRMHGLKKQERQAKQAEKYYQLGLCVSRIYRMAQLEEELQTCTDDVYQSYHEAERLARAGSPTPEEHANELFAASQQLHQARLLLTERLESWESLRRQLEPREAVTLSRICDWVSAALQTDPALARLRIKERFDLADNPFISPELQVPLVTLLCHLLRQALRSFQPDEAYLSFASALGARKLRLLLTISPKRTGAEPTEQLLLPIDLGELKPLVTLLGAHCSAARGNDDCLLFVIEIDWR